jgi:hypothetical protein
LAQRSIRRVAILGCHALLSMGPMSRRQPRSQVPPGDGRGRWAKLGRGCDQEYFEPGRCNNKGWFAWIIFEGETIRQRARKEKEKREERRKAGEGGTPAGEEQEGEREREKEEKEKKEEKGGTITQPEAFLSQRDKFHGVSLPGGLLLFW